MDGRSAPIGERTVDTPLVPRQRWRLVVARSAGAPQLAGRESIDAWEAAIEASGLPLHVPAGRSRARVAIGAPLSVGMAGEGELAEIVLTQALPAWHVRNALAGRLPAGWELVDLYDVWLGARALVALVCGAVYRAVLGGTPDADALAAGAAALLRADRLPRTRQKGDGLVDYDLRPLLEEILVIDQGPRVVVRLRTVIHPELGTGRPEEVLAALAEQLGSPIAAESIVRERLVVAGEPG